jgi:RIO kinase 1
MARKHASRAPRGWAESNVPPGCSAAPCEDSAAQLAPEFAAAIQFSKYERNWIRKHLGTFYQKELIVDVARRIRAGKEATVYACIGHASTGRSVIAAKLYRERSLRGSRNAGEYQEGRSMLDEDGNAAGFRSRSGERRRTRKLKTGPAASQTSWLMHEFELLQQLHARGGDVPGPLAHAEHALLMEFIGEGTNAAPTLNEVELEAGEARQLFERVIFNVDLLLQLGWVHGDLSGYNILYDRGRVVLIDFPQVVDRRNNPRARALFERDVQRVAQCFARDDWRIDHERLAHQLWSKYLSGPEPPPEVS